GGAGAVEVPSNAPPPGARLPLAANLAAAHEAAVEVVIDAVEAEHGYGRERARRHVAVELAPLAARIGADVAAAPVVDGDRRRNRRLGDRTGTEIGSPSRPGQPSQGQCGETGNGFIHLLPPHGFERVLCLLDTQQGAGGLV